MDSSPINYSTSDLSAEITVLIVRLRNIVKPGVYRLSNGRWKKYHESRFRRIKGQVIQKRLVLIMQQAEARHEFQYIQGAGTLSHPHEIIAASSRTRFYNLLFIGHICK